MLRSLGIWSRRVSIVEYGEPVGLSLDVFRSWYLEYLRECLTEVWMKRSCLKHNFSIDALSNKRFFSQLFTSNIQIGHLSICLSG